MNQQKYRRLPGLHTNLLMRGRLWVRNDDVLWVQSNGIVERYCRYYFGSIWGLTVKPLQRGRRIAFRLRNLRVEAESPVRAIVGRPFDVVLVVHIQERRSALTPEFDVPTEVEDVRFPNPIRIVGEVSYQRIGGVSRLMERGRFKCSRLNVEVRSAFELWLIRRNYGLEIAIHWYPDLHRDRRALVAQNVNKNLVARSSRLVRRGCAFERLWESVPGEELNDVYSRATAKRRKVITSSASFHVVRAHERWRSHIVRGANRERQNHR